MVREGAAKLPPGTPSVGDISFPDPPQAHLSTCGQGIIQAPMRRELYTALHEAPKRPAIGTGRRSHQLKHLRDRLSAQLRRRVEDGVAACAA